MALLLLLTILLSLFALLFASVFVIAYFWDSYRLIEEDAEALRRTP